MTLEQILIGIGIFVAVDIVIGVGGAIIVAYNKYKKENDIDNFVKSMRNKKGESE